MKLQELVFIFLIIIIPIILIFTYYLNLQADTIRIQMDYDRKLVEATKEAVQAFEINTTEWNSQYNSLANVKRRELNAATNVFIASLSNKLGISNTSKENILNYIPAMVYIMYDGYYIYSPTYVPKTVTDNEGLQVFYYGDIEGVEEGLKFTTSGTQSIKGIAYAGKPVYQAENGASGEYNYNDGNSNRTIQFTYTLEREEAIKEYKHVLKTFVPYSKTIGNNTINYTLDNYVRIIEEDGKISEGYIIENYEDILVPEYSINGIRYGDISILPEILTENIIIRENDELVPKKFEYIYNSNSDKIYYDGETFFTLDSEYNKRYFKGVNANSSLAQFKKIVVKSGDNEYLNLYQLLNPETPQDEGIYVFNPSEKKYKQYSRNVEGIPALQYDCSAISFFVENYCFNSYIKNHPSLYNIDILSEKKQAIIDNINENLNLSIANYSANSKNEYKLPELKDEDWEQALSNISMITFLQGVKTGLKIYNNYAIVTSTENNEYVTPNSLYYVFKDEENQTQDEYYHKYPCMSAVGEIEQGYRNIEFKLKNYDNESYYKHTNYVKNENDEFIPTYGIRECFNCIVNRNKNNLEGFNNTNWTRIHETAIARERYVQVSRTRLDLATSYNNLKIKYTVTIDESIVAQGQTQNDKSINIDSFENRSFKVLIEASGGNEEYTFNWWENMEEQYTNNNISSDTYSGVIEDLYGSYTIECNAGDGTKTINIRVIFNII